MTSLLEKSLFRPPKLTKLRIGCALAVALFTDLLQISLGPLGWFWADQGLDIMAMALTTAALGFHVLLLPTFALEFMPLVEMLPSWTGCTLLVISLRKRAEHRTAGPPSAEGHSEAPPIDVEAEVTQVPPKL